MSAELVAVRLGTALVGRAAHLLLAKQQGDQDRRSDMDGLIRRYIPGLRHQRSVQRQFGQIADAVAERLEPMLAHEFRGMDEGEHTAVIDAVVRTFEQADLSDAAIFASNADPAQLSRRIRLEATPPIGLSAAGTALYDQLIAESCDCYVQIVRHLPVFTERAVAELLSRVDVLGNEVTQVLERLPKRSLYAPDGSDHDSAFRREYLELISRTLDEVELFSFAVEQPLRTKLSVAYVSLRVASESYPTMGDGSRITPEDLAPSHTGARRADEHTSGGRRVESALSRKSRILIRGEAGSGKTTLLRWLAITAARASFTGELASWNGLVPVLLRLRSYAARDLPKLHELLDDAAGPLTSHMPKAWIDRRLADGKVLLLIDGVDELVPADRGKVREWISVLLHAYPHTRLIVTSRPTAAQHDWLDTADFAPIELERMTPADLNAFIHQWHQAVGASGQRLPCAPAELPDYERALIASVQDRPHMHALAANPLLAAMLCSLHLRRRRQLPRNRMELYQIAVELLVQRRDAERNIPSAQRVSLSLTDKVAMLRDLAWRLTDNNLTEIDTDKAEGYVAAKIASMRHIEVDPHDVLEYLLNRSGILRSSAEGRIDFVHRTFQEYLAAAEAAAQDRMGNLVGRAHMDVWRDTVIMAAGHANSSQRRELITGILDRAEDDDRNARSLRLLAVSCLETIESLSDQLADRLDETIAELVPPHEIDEVISLVAVGEPLLRFLPKKLDDIPDVSARATVQSVALIGGAPSLRLLAGYTEDRRADIQQEIVHTWEYYDPVEYADSVLASFPPELSVPVILSRPRLWRSIAGLGNLGIVIVDFPTSIDKLKTDKPPATPILSLTRLTGANDIAALADSCNPDCLRELILGTSDDQAVLSGLDTLATYSGLRLLHVVGWNSLPQLSAASLPTHLHGLGLRFVPADYDLRFVVEHGLSDLKLGGNGSPAALVAVGRAPGLERLTLTKCDLTDALPALIATVPRLRSLELTGVALPDDLAPLDDLPLLETISLTKCTGTNGRLIRLSSIPRPQAPRRLFVTVDGYRVPSEAMGL
ncbi:NACHT domain-containing protein [Nocardia tenerifensis]|uniref:NACHT domain-containing protein n=1 Tax=Nocardia tenerifensis TaxID=228006 RepID=A0A318K8D6_9NOCA|nr:NACHT domain-containing protein [Nocardia tenerifensis]PXX60303.1 NACHT domain-containing protein [Nocardia tenerifensis]